MRDGEESDATSDGENHQIFIHGISFLKESEVQEHDWEELARFGENESQIVDMSQ